MMQYWANMAANLTSLDVTFGYDVTESTSAALSQLSALERLFFDTDPDGELLSGCFHLDLPSLRDADLNVFHSATLALNCPQLSRLSLNQIRPLKSFSGMPKGLESLTLINLGAGSVPLHDIFALQKLEQLRDLTILSCEGGLEGISNSRFSGNLTSLRTDSQLDVPLLRRLPWRGLLCSLHRLTLQIPLMNGLPLVLEQLSSLKHLAIHNSGSTTMHLDRPLDPFLEMASLTTLTLLGDSGERCGYSSWTPHALRLLGLAQQRILQMQRRPGGKAMRLYH